MYVYICRCKGHKVKSCELTWGQSINCHLKNTVHEMSDMLNIAVTDTFLHRLYETDKYIHEARGSVGNFSLSVYDKLQFTLIQISTRIASF